MVQNARTERDDTRRLIGGDRDDERGRGRGGPWEEERPERATRLNVETEKTRDTV